MSTLKLVPVGQQRQSEPELLLAGPSTGVPLHHDGSDLVDGSEKLRGAFPGPQLLAFGLPEAGGVLRSPRSPVVALLKNLIVPTEIASPTLLFTGGLPLISLKPTLLY